MPKDATSEQKAEWAAYGIKVAAISYTPAVASGLQAESAPATFPEVDKPSMTIDLFRERCAAMRAERASKAWDIEIELPRGSDEPEEMTQRPTAAKAEQDARDERRRVALAASGGPRRRVEHG